MNQDTTAFIELMQWVKDQKQIPLQTRRDLMQHLMKTGSLDEKSQQFIERLMQAKAAQQEAEATQLEALDSKLMALGKAAHSESGLKSKVLKEAEELVNGLQHHFVNSFKARKKEVAAQAEAQQGQSEADQVAALKASVGA